MPNLHCWCRLLLQGPRPQYYLRITITTVTKKFKCKVKEKLVRDTCIQIQKSPKLEENSQVLKQPTNLQMQKPPDTQINYKF
jgi:hypothetical protein